MSSRGGAARGAGESTHLSRVSGSASAGRAWSPTWPSTGSTPARRSAPLRWTGHCRHSRTSLRAFARDPAASSRPWRVCDRARGSCWRGCPQAPEPSLFPGARTDLHHTQGGGHERDEPHRLLGRTELLQGPADQPEVHRADHLLAVAGELVERAVVQPDLGPVGGRFGPEPDVVEHLYDALHPRRACPAPRLAARPRPKPPPALPVRGLRSAGAGPPAGEDSPQEP